MNASMTFPWYTFLHDAGCNVLTFDPRGFGRSSGKPSLWAWLLDMDYVMDWVRARPDVRSDRLAVFGVEMGATVAMLAAARFGPVAAVIAEDPISPRAHIRHAHGEGLGGALQSGMAESAAIPDGSEPDETAALLRVPVLFLGGQGARTLDRRALLRTFVKAPEPKSLWLMPDTGPAPNSLMAQAGEYQAAVIRFLQVLRGNEPERVSAEWKESGNGAIEVTLARKGGDGSPWAVLVGVTDSTSTYTFHRVWLDASRSSFQFKVKAAPGLVNAVRYHNVVDSEDGSGWRPQAPAIERAGRLWQRLAEDAERLRSGNATDEDRTRLWGKLRQLEQDGAFPRDLDAMLAETWWLLGKELVASSDATRRAEGLACLRRAAAAEPAKPMLWFWAGDPVVFGFPHGEAVKSAQALLAREEAR
jgi:pimeloyl-ACP methyl ester carboxylesterase